MNRFLAIMMWDLLEMANMARSGNMLGYFPTPSNVSKIMTVMTMTESDKTRKVAGPCVRHRNIPITRFKLQLEALRTGYMP